MWYTVTMALIKKGTTSKVKKNAERLYVVRLYDGFDSLWIDVSKPMRYADAQAIWNAKTNNGTQKTSYSDIDYFAIFPADTEMVHGSQNYDALVKAGLIRP